MYCMLLFHSLFNLWITTPPFFTHRNFPVLQYPTVPPSFFAYSLTTPTLPLFLTPLIPLPRLLLPGLLCPPLLRLLAHPSLSTFFYHCSVASTTRWQPLPDHQSMLLLHLLPTNNQQNYTRKDDCQCNEWGTGVKRKIIICLMPHEYDSCNGCHFYITWWYNAFVATQ